MQISKVYGPYLRKDNRRIVFIKFADGSKTTKSYARYLFEKANGKIQDKNITVDHIDNDKQNDTIENFQLLSRADNARKSKKPVPLWFGFCPNCSNGFSRPARMVKRNQAKRNCSGPFCSKQCVGSFHARQK